MDGCQFAGEGLEILVTDPQGILEAVAEFVSSAVDVRAVADQDLAALPVRLTKSGRLEDSAPKR